MQAHNRSCLRRDDTVTFNGEIYNFASLRSQIDRESGNAIRWRGHADTEVLTEAMGVWGVEKALEKIEGMFAIGVWIAPKKSYG